MSRFRDILKQKRFLTLYAVSLAMLTCAGLTLAGKGGAKGGGGKGGGEDPPPTGSVFFSLLSDDETGSFQVYSMNPDGTGKQALPIVFGFPSCGLHGGQRWFIDIRAI